jgi:hypothetical protein
MLTIKQLVVIETQSSALPLRVGDLRKKFGPGPLSLRSIIRQVGTKKVVLFVQVRDFSGLSSVTSLAQFQSAWKRSVPSKATLALLSQILSSTGGSIVYLSRDWQTVGIAGTTESLAGFPGKFLDLKTGIPTLGFAVGGEAALIVTILGISGPVGWTIIGTGIAGSFALGAVAGVGLFDITNSDPAASLPPSEPIVLPEITLYGELPSDVTEVELIDLPPIDAGALPDVPPDVPPDGGNGGPGL